MSKTPHVLLCTERLINIHLINDCGSLLLQTEYISPGKMKTELQSPGKKYNQLKHIPKTHFTEREKIISFNSLAEMVPKQSTMLAFLSITDFKG